MGDCTKAFEKRTPFPASQSMFGVFNVGWPAQDR
jgi:hypothetical protein